MLYFASTISQTFPTQYVSSLLFRVKHTKIHLSLFFTLLLMAPINSLNGIWESNFTV